MLGAESEFRPRELTPWPRLAKNSFPQHGLHSPESEKGLIRIALCLEYDHSTSSPSQATYATQVGKISAKNSNNLLKTSLGKCESIEPLGDSDIKGVCTNSQVILYGHQKQDEEQGGSESLNPHPDLPPPWNKSIKLLRKGWQELPNLEHRQRPTAAKKGGHNSHYCSESLRKPCGLRSLEILYFCRSGRITE